MQRFGQVIGIKAEHLDEYKRLHATVWPEVLIQNYSIYLLNENTLFSYFEYVGDDFDGDMAKMAADPKTQEWWDVCKPMQDPLPNRADGEWWMTLEEVFHHD